MVRHSTQYQNSGFPYQKCSDSTTNHLTHNLGKLRESVYSLQSLNRKFRIYVFKKSNNNRLSHIYNYQTYSDLMLHTLIRRIGIISATNTHCKFTSLLDSTSMSRLCNFNRYYNKKIKKFYSF